MLCLLFTEVALNISQRIGKTLGFTSATWITIFGGILAILGIPLFLAHFDWIAIAILTLSFLTDWWDGCVARFHQNGRPEVTREEEAKLSLWECLNYRGVTHLGRSIDPLVDKIRFLGLMWVVGYHVLDLAVMMLLTLIAVFLTLVRPIKSYFKLDHGGANQWGKYKVYAEVILMVVLVFGTRPLYGSANPLASLSATRFVIDMMSLVTVFLATASAWIHFESGAMYYFYLRRTSC